MIKNDLQNFIDFCVVAHHIPGRLRVKLCDQSNGLPQRAEAEAFLKRVQDLPGVNNVSVNLLARSCTLQYDAAVIPPAALDDLFAARRSQAADTLAMHLNPEPGA